MLNKSFFYGYVLHGEKHKATFLGGPNFNEIKWNTIKADEDCWNLQLIDCYDMSKFPFVIASNSLSSKIFLVNS